jgi:hypothetical protein
MVQPVQSRWRWLLGGLALALAAATVAGLVYIRFGTQRGAPSAAAAPSGRVIGSLEMAARTDFSCSLPVRDPRGAEARISLPSGTVTLDHAASGGGPTPTNPGTTYLHGRWLPVPSSWVSPDGRSYAYATQTSGAPGAPITSAVVVHDIAGGDDRRLWSGTGHGIVAGWVPGGIYFTLQPASPDGKGWIDVVDVWVVDPARPAAAHRIGPNPAQPRPTSEAELPLFAAGSARLGDGAAWTIELGAPVGPITPGGGVLVRAPSRLVRMDLRDGSLSAWYTASPGIALGLSGLDAQGHPVLVAVDYGDPRASANLIPPPPRILLVTGPDHAVTIADGSDQSLRPTSMASDARGIWFAAPGSLWLYRGGRLARLADVPASVFPPPTPFAPPPGRPAPPAPPPGYPTGSVLSIVGACT